MSVFWINTPVLKPNGGSIGYPFECKAESVEALCEELAERGIVSGNQLRTVDDGRGGKLVQTRKAMGLTIKGIASITTYDFHVWEPE